MTPRWIKAGEGSIVNISSIVGLAPEFAMTVYGATKAFVLFLSQGMDVELSSKGIYIQAVLPAGTYTEIWDRAGIDISNSPKFMEVGELVDAALIGFDRRERVTIPPYTMRHAGTPSMLRVRLCFQTSNKMKPQSDIKPCS